MFHKLFKKNAKQINLSVDESALTHMQELSDKEASSVVGGFSFGTGAIQFENDTEVIFNFRQSYGGLTVRN
jgi:hypothetical protein